MKGPKEKNRVFTICNDCEDFGWSSISLCENKEIKRENATIEFIGIETKNCGTEYLYLTPDWCPHLGK